MKRTLLTILALGSASFAVADSITATTELSTGTGYTNDGNRRSGFVVNLAEAVTYTLNNSEITDFTAYDSVKLDSITLNTATSNNSASSARIVVYKLDSITGDDRTTNLTYCGVSDYVTIQDQTAVTFTFTAAFTLSTDGAYGFFFVNDTDTISDTVLSSATSLSTISDGLVAFRVQHTWSNMPGAELKADGTSWSNGEIPIATYNITATKADANVPEPATATLSLLALAGLAARRRRK